MHKIQSLFRTDRLIFAFLILIFLTPTKIAWAQTPGAIVGSVEDPNGGRLPGARVVAINEGAGQRFEAVSNGDGEFQIIGLSHGKYRVEITLNGFGKKTFNDAQIETNSSFRMKITLSPA